MLTKEFGTTDISKLQQSQYASRSLTVISNAWRYSMQLNKNNINICQSFGQANRKELVPKDQECRAREKLRTVNQRGCVSSYVSNLQNIALTVPYLHTEELLDRFMKGMKPPSAPEVGKSSCMTLEDAVKVALRINPAQKERTRHENVHHGISLDKPGQTLW